MRSIEAFAQSRLSELASRELLRTLQPTRRIDAVRVRRGERDLISFSGNDYLGLSGDPRLLTAAQAAIAEHGSGAGASRLVTGDHPLLSELEERLAAFKGTDAACVFGSGYLANLGIIPTFAGRGDLILLDELVHSCIRAGARVSSAETVFFRHNDMAHLRSLLQDQRAAYRNCLIATDGVFSMDGDLAPLQALCRLAESHESWLLVDDAHGVGVLNGGRGSTIGCDVPLLMGTLSKSLGGYGGYLCASQPIVDLVKTRAASFIYTTGLPPACAASAIAAIDIIESDEQLVARPLEGALRFTEKMNLPPATSAIVPIIVGEPEIALRQSRLLEDEGFLVTAIRPPTVPTGTSRLRVTFSAAHTPRDIDRLVAAFGRIRKDA